MVVCFEGEVAVEIENQSGHGDRDDAKVTNVEIEKNQMKKNVLEREG